MDGAYTAKRSIAEAHSVGVWALGKRVHPGWALAELRYVLFVLFLLEHRQPWSAGEDDVVQQSEP